MTSQPTSRAEHGADLRGLDGVHELVLAVAGAVLEAAERAHDLRVQARAVRLEHRLFAGLRISFSTSWRDFSTTSSMRVGWMRPS